MVTGGSEAAITNMGLGGFICRAGPVHAQRQPASRVRPFDNDRDGFVLAEGAGILILEELEHAKKRGARIYAELLGTGNTADAYNITAPHPEGTGAARAMQLALKDARLNPERHRLRQRPRHQHRTGRRRRDPGRQEGLRRTCQQARHLQHQEHDRPSCSAPSGGVELIATVLSIKDCVVHPTINLDNPDPACDLDYVPKTARKMPVRYALSNSFGFGGHNASLVVGALR